jgi:hypothetical protein
MPCNALASGLVYNSTSRTDLAGKLLASSPHLVDRKQHRIRKVSHAVKTTARLHQEEIASSGFRFKPAMITCTYAPDKSWAKKDITGLLDNCKKYLLRRYSQSRFRYTWVAELTKKGTIHYHIILWLPKGCTLPKPDKKGWWSKGSTRIEWVKNSIGYLAKYASKGSDTNHDFPKGARISGFAGLADTSRREYRFWRTPASIREAFNPKQLLAPSSFDLRKTTGGYFNKDSGEFIESEYRLVLINGSQYIIKKATLYV